MARKKRALLSFAKTTALPKLRRNLQTLRLHYGTTQQELTELLGLQTQGAYSKIELGERKLTAEQAYILCNYFNISLGQLLDKVRLPTPLED